MFRLIPRGSRVPAYVTSLGIGIFRFGKSCPTEGLSERSFCSDGVTALFVNSGHLFCTVTVMVGEAPTIILRPAVYPRCIDNVGDALTSQITRRPHAALPPRLRDNPLP